MNEFNEIAQSHPTFVLGLLALLFGLVIYVLSDIVAKKKIKSIKTLRESGYFTKNSLVLVLSLFVGFGLFFVSWWSNTMTYERCLFIGPLITASLGKFMNRTEVN